MPFSLFKEKMEVGLAEAEIQAQKKLGQYPPVIKWVLIVCLVGMIPAYFLAKSLSYRYWLAHYQPSQLDAHPSFANSQSPKLLDLTLTTTGNNTYALAATVQNQNLDLVTNNLSYSFQFFDSQKNPVLPLTGDVAGQTYLLPHQKHYLIIPKLTTTQPIAAVNLTFGENTKWQKRFGLPKVELITDIPNFYQQFSPLTFVVEGSVQNNSPYHVKTVELVFLAFSADKKIIASSLRDEYDLQPFERRAYKQLWPNVGGQNVNQVQVIAQTNVLDPANLSVPQTAPGPASDLSRPVPKNPSGF